MNGKSERLMLLLLIALQIASITMVTPARAGFPPRSYEGIGAGAATFYVTPQDSNFTSQKPIDNRTGEWFSVEVRIANHSHVASWQFQLIWKTGLLSIPYPLFNVTKGSPYIFAGLPGTGLSTSVDPFNGTHTGLLASESTLGGLEAPAASDSGLVVIWFQIKADPDPGRTLSTMLYFVETKPPSLVHKTWTQDTDLDENDCTMFDGYYENKYPAPPAPPAAIYVDPPKKIDPTLVPCKNFTINVNIKNATLLRQFGFKLVFNSTLLNVVNATLGSFVPPTAIYTIIINNTEGHVTYSVSVDPPDPPLSGNGTLAEITFHVESLGFCNLTLTETSLVDDYGNPIPHSATGGYFNNILQPKIAVQPPEIIDPTKLPPQTFEINITIAEVTDLYGYAFKLGYDPRVLIALRVTIHDVLGETNYIPSFSVDNTHGIVTVNVTYFEPANPISTIPPLTFVTVKFRVSGRGVTALDLYDTSLTNNLGQPISHEAHDGFFANIIRDIAVINVVPDVTDAYQGWIVQINVTARNEGDLRENFTVEVYYGISDLIGTLAFVNVDPSEEVWLTIQWNTKDVQACRNYTIWATAIPLPYETDLSDNTFTDGVVKIWLMGDVTHDGAVDGKDISKIAAAFGSYPGHPRWNPIADLNRDDAVDGKDISKCAANFGKEC